MDADGNVPVMERVGVITDSSACVPAEFVDDLDIRVLPISVLLSEDGGDSTSELDGGADLAEAIALEELAGANHPFVTEYLAAIESPDFDAAVIIAPAIEFATMYRNAALAVEFATRPARAIDARTAAAGQALVVLAGAEAAQRGDSLEDVVKAIEDASRRVEIVASLASLEEIQRSGPVPGDVFDESGAVGTRSLFSMRDGVVEPVGTAASADEALAMIHAVYAERTGKGVERSTVFHAKAPRLAERLGALIGGADFISGFSAAMQVHTGGGVVGVAWIRESE